MSWIEQNETAAQEQTADESFTSGGNDTDEAGYDFFMRPLYSDCVFKCQDRTWKCHRAILGSRCSYFDAICSGSYQESTSRTIELVDQNAQAVELMLFYLYSKHDMRDVFEDNKTTDAENITIVADTIIVADKYHFIKLTSTCVGILKRLIRNLHCGADENETMLAIIAMAKYVYGKEVPAVSKALEPYVIRIIRVGCRDSPTLRERVLNWVKRYERLWKDVMKAAFVPPEESSSEEEAEE